MDCFHIDELVGRDLCQARFRLRRMGNRLDRDGGRCIKLCEHRVLHFLVLHGRLHTVLLALIFEADLALDPQFLLLHRLLAFARAVADTVLRDDPTSLLGRQAALLALLLHDLRRPLLLQHHVMRLVSLILER